MNTSNLWVVARVGECCRCECAGCGQYGWVQMDCPPQWFTNEFGSHGTLQTMFVFGNSTWRYGMWSVAWYPHVLYRFWPIGVAAKRLELLNRRCRTLLAWLWPCGRKVTSLLRGASIYMVMAMRDKRKVGVIGVFIFWYIHIWCLMYFYVLSFSSPYLLVFGDDRVHGTREQMMLQVELVRLSRWVGEKPGSFILFDFDIFCKLWWEAF